MAHEQRDESQAFVRGTMLTWLRAVMWLAAAVPITMFVLAAWHLHRQAIAQAQSRVERAARVAEEHASKVFETNIALLNRVDDALGVDSEGKLRAREGALYEQLVRMTADLRQLQGIFVMSAGGRLLASNRMYPVPRTIDFTDRPFYRYHLAGGAQPFFSGVLTSRSTNEPFFNMSVPRTAADGRFSGILSASMAPQYFFDFYSELTGKDDDLNVVLKHADGAVLAAWPHLPVPSDVPGTPAMGDAASAARAPASPPTAVRDAEAQPRITTERRVGTYPVQVVAWVDRSAALAPWFRQLAMLAAFVFPSAIALGYVAWLALRRTQRSLHIMQSLEEETAQRLLVEETLRKVQKLEALGRLGGGVAHDFNNLLMVIGNNLYLHRKLQPSVADSGQLSAIERAVAAGTKLTRQLLSFSRWQALRPERVALQERLPGVLELLAPALGTAISVEARVEPDTLPVEVDVAELELAVLNLAINARDAMPDGGKLQLTVANAAAGEPPGLAGKFVVLSVRDTGQGIAPELLERVFEPFFTTKDVGQGTGLGLSQVYGFCVRAGGTATMESRFGAGTTVRMYLPVGSQSSKPQIAAAPSAVESLHGLRVLLVEDNGDVAMTIVSVLESNGCKVRRLHSADAAIGVLAADAREFDIVLSDIVMPGALDGIGLAVRLQAEHPQLPVLLMSGYSASMDSAGALGVDVLPKPCTPAALSVAIRSALARSRESNEEAA